MPTSCPNCKNLNVVDSKDPHTFADYSWCRNCGWTSDGKEPPLLTNQTNRRR